MNARLRAIRRDVELFTLVGLARLLAAAGAILTAIEGPQPDPLDDPSRSDR